jgi:hypothetical protein
MHKPESAPHMLAPDVRVTLDVERLNLLRQRPADGGDRVAGKFLDRRQCLTQAALKRAASGRPVRFRTVRHLAAFYGIGVEALIAPAARSVAAAAAGRAFGVERLQCAALFDAVLATGQGRLADVRGAPGSDKSAMLAECTEDARQRGFAAIVVGLSRARAQALHPLAQLVRALLYIGTGTVDDAGADMDELVRSRCRALDLCAEHVDACLGMLAGPSSWPLPSTQVLHAAALCALIRQRARRQPLALVVDDVQCADWTMATMLDTVLPATLDLPLVWMLGTEAQPGPQSDPLGARLDALPRTTFHLAGVPGARAVPCAASVLRVARTRSVN